MPIPCSAIASSPDVTCSPDATTASYSRASCIGEASLHQATSSLVLPDMAETTTATSCPASTSRFTCCATLRIRSILATDVPPNFITRRPMTTRAFSKEDKFLARRKSGRHPGRNALYRGRRPGASGFLFAAGSGGFGPGKGSVFSQVRRVDGALCRSDPAARRDGPLLHQCALDLL